MRAYVGRRGPGVSIGLFGLIIALPFIAVYYLAGAFLFALVLLFKIGSYLYGRYQFRHRVETYQPVTARPRTLAKDGDPGLWVPQSYYDANK